MFFHFAVTDLFVIIVPCSGGSVEVLLKEGEDKCAEVLPKEGEDKCVVAGVAVGVVALVKAVDVAMCEKGNVEKSAEQLDKELDNYHSGAMNVD